MLLFRSIFCINEKWNFKMQVIDKLDIIFRVVYSVLIVIMGVVLFVMSQDWVTMAVAFLGAVVYLFLTSRKNLRRYRALRQLFPDEWRSLLKRCSAFYNHLDEQGKQRFERDVQLFLSDFTIRGIKGQEIDTKTRLLVAAGSATLLHGRPSWEPPIKDGVVVYPGSRFDRDYQPGKGWRAGQASHRGPLLVTQGSLQHSFKDPHDGYNVILHELAHYFDLEDGQANGIPGLGMPSESLYAWKEIIYREWQRVLRAESFLDPYAGVNEAEFFAVATEFFFEKPWLMQENSPELYQALKEFYNLDTLAIFSK
jgi:hypothetical protein